MIFDDLRYAIRQLMRAPLLTAILVVILSIGMTAPTIGFNLLSGFAFNTPVANRQDSFFSVIRIGDGKLRPVARPSYYESLRANAETARLVTAWSVFRLNSTVDVAGEDPVGGLLVGCEIFSVFDVEVPIKGRLLNQRDCDNREPVVVLTERFWRARLAADPGVVGTSLTYGNYPATIVGVASTLPLQLSVRDPDFVADLLFPYSVYGNEAIKETDVFDGHFLRPDSPWLAVAGVLNDGVNRDVASAEFRVLDEQQGEERGIREMRTIALTDGSRWAALRAEVASLMVVALSLPMIILAIACVNASSLLLSRAVGRKQEMAVRMALGTSRSALMRLLLLEIALIATVAGLASVLLAYFAVPRIVAALDAQHWFGAMEAIAPDWRLFAFVGVCVGIVICLSGLAPASESLRLNLAQRLGGQATGGGGRRTVRLRSMLASFQIAVTVFLLGTAAFVYSSLARADDPGFTVPGLVVASITGETLSAPRVAELEESLRTQAGVVSVASSTELPFIWEAGKPVRVPETNVRAYPVAAAVSPDYFRTLELAVLRGRAFEDADVTSPGAAVPLVVSRQFAERFLGGNGAVGAIIEYGADGETQGVVIGVVENRIAGLSRHWDAVLDGSIVYEPLPATAQLVYFMVRVDANAEDRAPAIVEQLRTLTDGTLVVQTYEDMLAAQFGAVRLLQAIFAGLGGGALFLAVLGVIALVLADARQRQHEFAVRRSLGASLGVIRRLMLYRGFHPVVIGMGVGVAVSWAVAILLDSQRVSTVEVAQFDALALLVPVALFLGTMSAVFLVAVKTSRVSLRGALLGE